MDEQIVKVENNVVKDDNVVCKMYLIGSPRQLLNTMERILIPLEEYKTNGAVDKSKTKKYALTVLVEKQEDTVDTP